MFPSLFCFLESILLLINSVAILSERFLKKYNLHAPNSENSSIISVKNQIAMILYLFRVYGKWFLIIGNSSFILLELLFG